MLSHVIWARETRIKSLSAKTVLLVLASHANKENKAYPSIPLLAKECSMTEQGVFNAIKVLSQGNPPYLTINREPGKHNTYWLMTSESFVKIDDEEALTPQPSLPPNYVYPPTTLTPPLNYVEGYPPTTLTPPPNVVEGKEQGNEIMKEQGKDKDMVVAASLSVPAESPAKKPRSSKRKDKHSLPDDFVLTDSLMGWAKENGHTHMQERYDYFVEQAKMKGYQYADWNLAFQRSVRDNWAKINITPFNSIPTFNTGGYNGNRKLSPAERHDQSVLAYEANIRRKNEALNPVRGERDISGLGHRVM